MVWVAMFYFGDYNKQLIDKKKRLRHTCKKQKNSPGQVSQIQVKSQVSENNCQTNKRNQTNKPKLIVKIIGKSARETCDVHESNSSFKSFG